MTKITRTHAIISPDSGSSYGTVISRHAGQEAAEAARERLSRRLPAETLVDAMYPIAEVDGRKGERVRYQ